MENKVLEKTRCYLVGHMEYGNGREWREEAKNRLNSLGVVCFDPYEKPFKYTIKEDEETQDKLKKLRKTNAALVHTHMKEIIAFDLAMVDRSDFIICCIDPSVPTYGTTHELVAANLAKKPIFVFVKGGIEKTPLWLMGLLSPKAFFNSLDDILLKLEKINNGSIKISSKRWRFLKRRYL